MRRDRQSESLSRRTRFETYEERLTFSAQPVNFVPFLASNHRAQDLEHRAAEQTAVGHTTDLTQAPAATPFTAAMRAASTISSQTTSATNRNFGWDGSGQTVAVIDSGIAYDHKALGGGFGAGNRVVGGWDFAENDADPYDDGPAGFHGTHVAGIIGSTDSRYKGIATGADLVALRVFDDQGNSDLSWVEKSLRWVHENRNAFRNPITTVNLSIGTTWNANNVPTWATLEDEFQLLKGDGIFVSVAAGNAFQEYKTTGLSYPAASTSVVPVASVDNNGQLSATSQRNDRVIAAPGQNIISTVPDFLDGISGNRNEFERSSGTSMATPYVSGASMLIRQAMQSLGYKNINQDTILDQMRKTADSVFDSITNASYSKLNLERALQSLAPADDYGSSANSAFSLGTLGKSGTFSGNINFSADADYFTFVAGQTGTLTLNTRTAANLVTNWQGDGGNSQNAAFSFEVVAGKTYTVGLVGKTGTGNYDVNYNVQERNQTPAPNPVRPVTPTPTTPAAPASPTVTNWGTVNFAQFQNQQLTSTESWFQFQAGRTGTVTLEAFFKHSQGDVNLELYNANKQLLASSQTATDVERLDVNGTAGQTYLVRVRGANPSVNLRVTNLVAANGSNVEIFGTDGNDTFTFVAGSQHQLSVNGVSYSFNSTSSNSFSFNGGGGSDSATWTGTSGAEQATLRVGSGELQGSNWTARSVSTEMLRVVGGGGNDRATLYDSIGDDQFTARPESAELTGNGFGNRVEGFRSVIAYATAGGNDTATLYDSAGNDALLVTSGYTSLYNANFNNRAQGFRTVDARASTGIDKAVFNGMDTGDTLVARGNAATWQNGRLNLKATGFDTVTARTRGSAPVAAELGAVDYLLEQVGNWRSTQRTTVVGLRGR